MSKDTKRLFLQVLMRSPIWERLNMGQKLNCLNEFMAISKDVVYERV